MKKNFKNFEKIFKNFTAVCLFETWCESQVKEESQSSNYISLGYNFFHQNRQYRRGGGVCLFVKESFCCKIRQNFSINCHAIEPLCLELTIKKSKNNSKFGI